MQNLEEKLQKIIDNKKNLENILPKLSKGKKKIKKNLYFGKNVKVEPNVFFDTSEGGILIGDGTKIKANSILRGPLLIGKNCVINSFAEISHSNIGDVCKIGGEIENSVIQSYSNKQHHGYLGNSYIGSWVNIGGGTSVSNLKNTYSSIFINGKDTGQIFLGCIMGDYVKTAINTSIFCGKVIGVSSHLYGIITHDVPAFTSYVSTENMYELPLDISKKIQKAMMERRGQKWSSKDDENFEKLFKETEVDRKKAKVKKAKLSFK